MSRLGETSSLILSVFGTAAWIAEGIETVPENYAANSAPYIRVFVLASQRGLNLQSTAGVLHIDIFTEAGKGPHEALRIAGILDSYFVGKTFSGDGTMQLQGSTLTSQGVDRDNTALYRHIYTIPFSYFGV